MRHITIRAALCALAITGCLIPATFAAEPAAFSATQTASEDSQPVDMTSALLRGLESTLPTVEQKVQQGDYAQAESRLRERQAQEAAYKEALSRPLSRRQLKKLLKRPLPKPLPRKQPERPRNRRLFPSVQPPASIRAPLLSTMIWTEATRNRPIRRRRTMKTLCA